MEFERVDSGMTHAKRRELKTKAHQRIKAAKAEGKKFSGWDGGRESCYKAEFIIMDAIGDEKIDFSSIANIRDLVKKVMSDERVIEIDPYPGEEVIVESSCTAGANARSFERRIRIGGRNDNIAVLHEIAHVLTPFDMHGPEFRAVYVKLVGWFVSEKAGAIAKQYMWVR